mgnify:CR=1 FL=1
MKNSQFEKSLQNYFCMKYKCLYACFLHIFLKSFNGYVRAWLLINPLKVRKKVRLDHTWKIKFVNGQTINNVHC